MSVAMMISLAWDEQTKDFVLDPVTGGLALVKGITALEQAVLLAMREHRATFLLINARPERLYQLLSQMEDDLQGEFCQLKLGGMRIAFDRENREISLRADLEGEDDRGIELKLKV